MEVIYEDNHLLVVNKPANWIVQGASPGQKSLLDWAADYLRVKYSKPGKVFVGVVSRLDGPVTGVLPLARTSKGASRLSEQFRNRSPNKIYWAIVENQPRETASRLEHHLVRNEDETKTRVVANATSNSKLSILEYRCVGQNELGYELAIQLISGRKHQIRAQLQAIGCSIVGDVKYGAQQPFPTGIALHCRQLDVEHPTLKTELRLRASLPNYWRWSSGPES
jgi:23S rRNA pseudouridine1911/1915/1917 synthase